MAAGVQVVNDGLKATGLGPALALSEHRWPGRKVAGQSAPGGADTHQPVGASGNQMEHRLEPLARGIVALRRVLAAQAQGGSADAPFVLGKVIGKTSPGKRHLS